MDITTLKYPKKSHRKTINYPEESIGLAELIGIEFGDGGINNNWQLVITLNATKDLIYSKYVAALLANLFNIETKIQKRPNMNAITLKSSKYLINRFFGVERSRKRQQNNPEN